MKNQFELLNSSSSWRSQLAVIVHIDLDAFYAQVLTVRHSIDPNLPLAARQWHSIIAVNYPARKFGIKRGMNIKMCRDLCPEIQLPHVPTFKKGATSWSIENEPQENTHKVSLDLFRCESRKIFEIFRENFGTVEKAGIDEGFMDLGPQVYAKALELYPQLQEYTEDLIPPEGFDGWHDVLLKLGGDMVHDARMQIHDRLKYTCSAGIAGNKHLAKLGSGHRKPFNQTVVLSGLQTEFLDEHKVSDIWGYGGKRGQQLLEELGVADKPSAIVELGLEGIFRRLQDMERARQVYETACGTYKLEVKARTMVKSMLSVKNFTYKPLNTMKDLQEWLIVYCSDLAGRMEDIMLDDPDNLVYRPQTIAVRYTGGVTKTQFSKQMPCSLPYHKSPVEALTSAVLALLPGDEKKVLPCTYFGVELSNLVSAKPSALFSRPEESLFVEEDAHYCKKCRRSIPPEEEGEHSDWHLARSLQMQYDGVGSSPVRSAVAKPGGPARKPAKPKSKGAPQKTLFNYFKPK